MSNKDRVLALRKTILLHSYIYYKLYDSVIEDCIFDSYCQELVRINEDCGYYDEEFKDFDGSTGYHLPHDAEIEQMAKEAMG